MPTITDANQAILDRANDAIANAVERIAATDLDDTWSLKYWADTLHHAATKKRDIVNFVPPYSPCERQQSDAPRAHRSPCERPNRR